MPSPTPADPRQPAARLDQPLTLDVLRFLMRNDWSRLPGKTLVVLSQDAEGNGFSPLSTYSHQRYSPVHDLRGEIYPLHSALAKDKKLRALYPEIPDDAVAALVLYPLG
ncbi:hypothetical protein AB0M86_29740 [Streptomyces sp. NPDC051639]|uniref:hypothetical protein n=1 Tax=unclassified Streptomyces TaxID=2593676 RepID=UPI002E2FFAC6|nr:hypothetical protein [Streptomyces sp. NBC_01462]